MKTSAGYLCVVSVLSLVPALPSRAEALDDGAEAPSVFGDWRGDRPGRKHRIQPADLPAPFATRSSANPPRVVMRPPAARPQAPSGFKVELLADGLEGPRILRVAPNGDLFVAETEAGRIRVLRGGEDGSALTENAVFASGLNGPFGIAFYPAQNPEWVYVAETNRVVRFAYKAGDVTPSAKPEIVVAMLSGTTGGHSTRDIAFSKDGARMFVSVGSASNVAQGLAQKSPGEIASWEAAYGVGAAWGAETSRAAVLTFTPDGKERRNFANGIRNCVGLAVHPTTGDVYCSTNERDGLGDNLVPDYVTRVREGGFYGWPWRYIGDAEDPRLKGARPDLTGKVIVPDVLLQPHSASLGMAFYTGSAFPARYRGSAFAALHGSWNRSSRTGYKIVHIPMRDGKPVGGYEDFLTGFIIDGDSVWGRPAAITTGNDGSVYVTEDGSGTIWRVRYTGG